MTDVLSAIVSKEPDLGVLPPDLPNSIRTLLRRCLEKDPRRRLRDAGELRIAIEELSNSANIHSEGRINDGTSRKSARSQLLSWGLVGALAIALAASLWNSEKPAVVTPEKVSRWSITLSRDTRIELPSPGGKFDYSRLLAVSPNGQRIVYTAKRGEGRAGFYLRDIAALESTLIPGTTGGRAPFFSPDGNWLAYHAEAALMKVAVTGGSPQKICDVGRMISFDGSWSPDGRDIVFATDEGLWQVSAAGGAADRLTAPDPERGEVGHHVPRYTPDGKGILFTLTETPEMHLALYSLESRSWQIILRNASQGVLLSPQRLVFARSGEILAAPLGADFEVLSGSTVSVVEGVYTSPGLGGMVLTQFDVSSTGTLTFVPRPVSQTEDQLLWVDRQGSESVIAGGAGTWVHPRLSPDGQRISVDIHSPDGMRDVYIYELERGQLNRLTDTGISWESEWRPDGERIATLSGAPAGQWSLFWIKTDFSDPAELLYKSGHAVPLSWLPDGSAFLFSKHRYDGGIWKLSTSGKAEPELVKATAARERFASLSPDGMWIAFVADESGRREVFVRSFPNQGPKYKVSIEGGGEPVWSGDGSKLYFREGDQMFSVALSYQPAFAAGRPELLFTGRYDAAEVGHQHYDVADDAERFLMIKHGETTGLHELRVVLNWSGELNQVK
jgi:serine/threonine-protein kinase